jgi:hypothetical protein
MRPAPAMRYALLCLTLAAAVRVHAVAPVAARVQEPNAAFEACLARAGIPDAPAFLAFDAELREALKTRDAATFAALAAYPLRVNQGSRGTVLVSTPAALQSRFDELVPPAIVSAVLGAAPRSIGCSATGVMYAAGAVWVGSIGTGGTSHLAVTVLNLPDTAAAGERIAPRVEFVCRAASLRAIVDVDGSGVYRYRAWNRPKALSDTPDLAVASGTRDYEGTGACGHPVWSFETGADTIAVLGKGCTPDAETSTGNLLITRGAKVLQRMDCY